MTAEPLAPDAKPPRRRRKTSTFWWCFLGLCTEALLFLLSTLSDACELPPPFEAMELKGVPKLYYEVGETIEYKCKKGYLYMLPFPMFATCEPNHTWVPISDDGCLKVECPTLKNPSFGNVHYMDGRPSWGNRAQFSCVEGYYLIGMSVLHCVLKGDADAHWDGPPPRCEKISCVPPPKIKNGTHTFSDIDVFRYREAVIYSCDPISGPDKFSLIGMSMLICTGQNTWSSQAPECKVVKCPFPLLQNGRQIAGFEKKFSYEATVTFECEEGFYMRGRDTVVCNANSTWEPPIPICIKGPKPTYPTKPPVYNYPGYPSPREGIFGQELDAWIIALIVVTSIVGLVVICLILLRYLEYRKKGKAELKAKHSTHQKKSASTIQSEKTPSMIQTPRSNLSDASNMTAAARK
ncbi:membrane cofactor protein [Microtus ochrogaster]|uniref:Membrane cofactor protein n=1 Tax=Microtus ochrogaster TaxID=79684 RepID=A0ABM0KLX8_MICOH|nr:membrane cofactor protein [Microtus ochrogaster]